MEDMNSHHKMLENTVKFCFMPNLIFWVKYCNLNVIQIIYREILDL
jgi:hypothetical protein